MRASAFNMLAENGSVDKIPTNMLHGERQERPVPFLMGFGHAGSTRNYDREPKSCRRDIAMRSSMNLGYLS